MNLTNEQIAIIETVSKTNDDLLVGALAGSGKTSTILAALGKLSMRNRSALLCAFNKRIAEELAQRIPPLPRTHAAHVKTFHALGLRTVKFHFPHFEIDSNACETFVNELVPEKTGYHMRRSVIRTLRLLKETKIAARGTLSIQEIIDTGMPFGTFDKLSSEQVDQTAKLAQLAYDESFNVDRIKGIDFCDMIWMPCALNLAPPSRYQAVFVDELQDVALPQFELLLRHIAPGGRIVGIGDLRQAIYGWRGATGDKIWRTLREDRGATELPLTMTFRCSKAVVALANELVPELRARDDAPDGMIGELAWENLPASVNIHGHQRSVYVLSRNNKDLLQAVLYLWQKRVRFQLNAGSEFLDPLVEILDKLDLTNQQRFASSLVTWYNEHNRRAEASGSVAWAERLADQYSMLSTASRYCAPGQIKGLLESLVKDRSAPIMCSTVHKVKGLEADSVFLLKQTFARHSREPWMTDPIDQEELNIEYVAITRARHDLFWVDMRGAGYINVEAPT